MPDSKGIEVVDLYDALEKAIRTRVEIARQVVLILAALTRNGQTWAGIAAELSSRIGESYAVSTVRGWRDPPKKTRP